MNENDITSCIPKPEMPMDELTELKYMLEVKRAKLEIMLNFNYFYKKHHTVMGFDGIPYTQARLMDKRILSDRKIIDDAPFPWYVRRQLKKDMEQLAGQITILENHSADLDLSNKKRTPNRKER